MLTKNGNGTTDFKNGNEDGWPASEEKKQVRRLEKQRVNKLVSTGTMVECTQDCTQTLS